MAYIVAADTALPLHRYSQDQLIAEFRELWAKKYVNVDRIEQFHRNVLVGSRSLALPIEEYKKLSGFGASNAAYIESAMEIVERLISGMLQKIGIDAGAIHVIVSTSVTGIAVPSLDARLMNRIAFKHSTKRIPLFGLGCMGGAAGLSRAADYLEGHPEESVLFFSVELCSLTLQREDLSIANIVSSGLFGDGAAAVLLAGRSSPLLGRVHPGLVHAAKPELGCPRIIDNESRFFPGTERVMGWDITDTGFQVVLDPGVPEFARDHLRPGIEAFLRRHSLEINDIDVWIAHPGGPKVISGMEEGLGLAAGTLSLSLQSLAEYGNLSSASVLFILKETLAKNPPRGSQGVLVAMGPAFAAEYMLLQW